MNPKNNKKTVEASTVVLAPKKEHIFSTQIVENGARIRLVSNAPQQTRESRREIRRVRAD